MHTVQFMYNSSKKNSIILYAWMQKQNKKSTYFYIGVQFVFICTKLYIIYVCRKIFFCAINMCVCAKKQHINKCVYESNIYVKIIMHCGQMISWNLYPTMQMIDHVYKLFTHK